MRISSRVFMPDQLNIFEVSGLNCGHWMRTKDGDSRARKLADRHYSRKTPGANLFCGPGEKLILVTPDYKALFVWRKSIFRLDGQGGVECSLFRNEGDILSSKLIQEAVAIARECWPGARLFTYVKDSAIRSSNPGYCFIKAGWRKCGRNKTGKLTILEFKGEGAHEEPEGGFSSAAWSKANEGGEKHHCR